MRAILLWAAGVTLLLSTVAHAQLLQIPGEDLARFAPDSLAGHDLANPMTGSTTGARRVIQPGAVEAVYALPGGAHANLSFNNTYGTTMSALTSSRR